MFVEKLKAGRIVAGTVLMAFALAMGGCGSTAKEDPNSQAALDKLYADAKDDLNSGSYDRAIKSLERIEGRAAGTTMGQQATLDLAWAYYRTAERAQAISTLDRFIKLNPSSPGLDYALYLRGLVNFNDNIGVLAWLSNQQLSERDQQASRDAYTSFKQLVEQFPESKYTPDAKLRMDYIVNALADYEVHVARYYLRRGAYLAAANRAQQAITTYPQSPAIEEALYIMGSAYDRLGLVQLRDDAERVLKGNFPQSRFLAGNEGDRGSRRWWQLW